MCVKRTTLLWAFTSQAIVFHTPMERHMQSLVPTRRYINQSVVHINNQNHDPM
jgi:hypothetical protein